MIPERYCTQVTQRMRSLIDTMEPTARTKDLLTSFTLMAAMPIVIIPLERVAQSRGSARNEINDLIVAPRFAKAWQKKRLENFLNAFVPDQLCRSNWRYLELSNEKIDKPSEWRDQLGRHPMSQGAVNEITKQNVENILTVMRHGLAHGSIIYLDEKGDENPMRKVTHLGFVVRATGQDRHYPKSFRVLIVEQEEFLSFLKRWTDWISDYEIAHSLVARVAA